MSIETTPCIQVACLECTSPGCPKTQNSSPNRLPRAVSCGQLQVFVLQYVIHIKNHININTLSALSIHPRMKTWSVACTCLPTYMLTFFFKERNLYLEVLFHIITVCLLKSFFSQPISECIIHPEWLRDKCSIFLKNAT